METALKVESFLDQLQCAETGSEVFNPWRQHDALNGIDRAGPEIRRRHLYHYLMERVDQARFLLIGEAIGYQGGHFSGLAMTSERILLGYHKDRGVPPEAVIQEIRPQRTNKPKLKEQGFAEPTATIVWGSIMESGFPPRFFALWNAFPWHPFRGTEGLLSNRKPRKQELQDSIPYLKAFLRLFPSKTRILAVGKTAERQFKELEIPHQPLRHPAQGGAPKFRHGFEEIVSSRFQ